MLANMWFDFCYVPTTNSLAILMITPAHGSITCNVDYNRSQSFAWNASFWKNVNSWVLCNTNQYRWIYVWTNVFPSTSCCFEGIKYIYEDTCSIRCVSQNLQWRCTQRHTDGRINHKTRSSFDHSWLQDTSNTIRRRHIQDVQANKDGYWGYKTSENIMQTIWRNHAEQKTDHM
jgi:hypothetical protein